MLKEPTRAIREAFYDVAHVQVLARDELAKRWSALPSADWLEVRGYLLSNENAFGLKWSDVERVVFEVDAGRSAGDQGDHDDLPEIPLVPKAEYFAEVAARGGDDGKVPTTTLQSLEYRGVSIASRYQKAIEMEIMVRMVSALGDHTAFVKGILCDSQACALYEVQLADAATEDHAEGVVIKLEEFLVASYGGHNGINVSGLNGIRAHASPNWREPSTEASGEKVSADDLSF